jgi:hypothetical protein
MPENDRVRLEIAFRSGQTLGVTVSSEVAEQLEAALVSADRDSLSFDSDDGRYTVVIKMVAFVKRHIRESRVGFGAVG